MAAPRSRKAWTCCLERLGAHNPDDQKNEDGNYEGDPELLSSGLRLIFCVVAVIFHCEVPLLQLKRGGARRRKTASWLHATPEPVIHQFHRQIQGSSDRLALATHGLARRALAMPAFHPIPDIQLIKPGSAGPVWTATQRPRTIGKGAKLPARAAHRVCLQLGRKQTFRFGGIPAGKLPSRYRPTCGH